MTAAIAGRFEGAFVASVAQELARHVVEPSAAGAGIAYCYGNRLETTQADFGDQFWVDNLAAGVKTDLALICLNRSGESRPLVHRERSQAWALDVQGRIPQLPDDEPTRAQATAALRSPGELSGSWTRSGFSNRPEDRFFAHLLTHLDSHDPVGSVEACRVEGAEEPRFFLLGPDALVLSAGSSDSGPELWFGRAQMVRVISPVWLECLAVVEWEAIPARTVMALTRFRHALA